MHTVPQCELLQPPQVEARHESCDGSSHTPGRNTAPLVLSSLLDVTKANTGPGFPFNMGHRRKPERQKNEHAASPPDMFVSNVSTWDLKHSTALLHGREIGVSGISAVCVSFYGHKEMHTDAQGMQLLYFAQLFCNNFAFSVI